MKFILGNKNETKNSVNNVNMSILITTGDHFWTISLRRVSLVHPHLKFEKFEIRKVIVCDSFHVTLGFIPSFAETNRGVTSLAMRLWKELWCKQRPILPLQVFPSPEYPGLQVQL